ncbi:MAG TPA: LysR family transcriptional regulator [Candidatus Aquilonibacter sp.]|nr:LysR family transcriptional regulator [Candidatus Aquilonibacter sp.]
MEFTSRQLRAFHLVAQYLNFARAAEALFITPSGLSVLIRELERQLGFRLFDRTTRKVTLTPRGRELCEVTRPALATLDGAMSRIERAEHGKARRITVGTTPWIAANVLPPAIKALRDLRPEVQVDIYDGTIGTIARRVEAGKLDLGLGILETMPGLRRVPFFRFSLMVIHADKDGLPNRASTKWTALNGQTLISLTPNYPHQKLIDKQLKKAGVTWKHGQTVNMLETQVGLVEAEQGIAIVPSFGLPACRGRKLTMSELVEPVVNLSFYEISSRARKLPEEAAEFSAFLKRYISRWAGEAGAL